MIAAIREGAVARKILAHLGLPTEPPLLRRAQADPQGYFWEKEDRRPTPHPLGRSLLSQPPVEVVADAEFVEPPPDDALDQRWPAPVE